MKFRLIRLLIGVVLIATLFTIPTDNPNLSYAQDYPREYGSAIWSPDGTMIAMSGNYGSVQVFDTDGNMLFDLVGHYPESFVDAVVWSPDSSRLASAGTDMDIHIWFIQPPAGQTAPYTPGQHVQTLHGHTYRIYDLAWSPDGSKLISVSDLDYYSIRVWDMNTYTLLVEKGGPDVNDVVWSPDGTKFLISSLAGAYIIEYDVIAQSPPTEVTLDYSETISDVYLMPISSVDWRAYNNTERIALGLENEIRIYDGETLALLDTIPTQSFTMGLTWNHDLSLLAGIDVETNHMYIWDITTSTVAGAFTQDKVSITTSIAWSPDDSQIAYGDHTLELVDTSCLVAPGDGNVPVMISPCETVDDSLWPTYSWWAADGADWYNIYVGDAATHTQHTLGPGGVWLEAAKVCNGDICEFRPVDGLEDTSPNYLALVDNTYDWSIRSFDSSTGVLGDWQPLQAFDVINPVPTILSPIDTSVTGWPTFTWTPVPDADWYHLWVGGQDNVVLIDEWLTADAVCDADECHFQARIPEEYLYGDEHNGLYQWHVQARHSSAEMTGAWQGTTLGVAPSAPGAPTVESSTPMVNIAGRHELTLTWEQGTYADFYQVWLRDANQNNIANLPWLYHEAICIDGLCSLTFYFDVEARYVVLGALNASRVPTWGPSHQLTIIEPSESLVAGQPPIVSSETMNGFDTDTETVEDFVPPSTLLPPVDIQVYPDMCGDHPLCDGPPTE